MMIACHPMRRKETMITMASHSVKQWFLDVMQFIRFPALAFTLILPLLGAATASSEVTLGQMVTLLLVALMFHTFAYVLNDVIDLPIDRTHPMRQNEPLVRGLIRPQQALFIAVIQIPLAFILAYWSGGNIFAYSALGGAFALLGVYDLFSKRTAFPPLIDLAQALGWGFLVLFGVGVVADHLTELAWAPFLFSIVYVMIINSLHSMKDIPNDVIYQAHTTPTFFGVRQTRSGAYVPRSFKGYLFVWQGLLCSAILFPLGANWFGYSRTIWATTLSITGVVCLGTSLLLVAIFRCLHTPYKALALGGLYYLFALMLPLLVVFPHLELSEKIVILATFALPVGAFLPTLDAWITRGGQESLT
jgi:4-hydroxybenzoate polyprenyltransferase